MTIGELLDRLGDRVVGMAPIVSTNPLERRMYEFLQPMQADVPVYHFTRPEYFAQMVGRKQLHMTRADLQANDPDDSKPPTVNALASGGSERVFESFFPMRRSERQHRYYSQIINRSYGFLHCWTATPPTDQMWTDFGAGGTGVCIKSSTGRFRGLWGKPADENAEVAMMRSSYWPREEPSPSHLGTWVQFIRKDERFAYQDEIRLIFMSWQDFESRENVKLTFDPLTIIEAVAVGADISCADKSLVLRAMQTSAIEDRLCLHSEI